MNNRLTDGQLGIVQDLFANDQAFRSLIQARFADEAKAAQARLAQLKDGAKAPKAKAASNKGGRPRGTSASDTKVGRLLAYIETNPDQTCEQILAGVVAAGVDMNQAMLHSYLYSLKKDGRVLAKGERGSRTYRSKK